MTGSSTCYLMISICISANDLDCSALVVGHDAHHRFKSSIGWMWSGLIGRLLFSQVFAKDCQELELPLAIQSKVLRHISFHAAWQEPLRSLVAMTFRKDELVPRVSL